ncbi:MAG: hypothetical protein ACTSX9_06355 [Candidatus Njordarchaeales archaeon]
MPVFFNVSWRDLKYPAGLNVAYLQTAYVYFSEVLVNVSSVAIIFAPLGISINGINAFSDPLVPGVLEKAQLYSLEKYDKVISLIGKSANLENFIALLRILEENNIPFSLYGFSHGVLNISANLHGVIVYSANGMPIVVNGDILKKYIPQPLNIIEFVWVACHIEDTYLKYGEESFASFFEKAKFFRIYGRGETKLPQAVIDLFDSVLSEDFETYKVPVAIIENGILKEGVFEIIVEKTVEEVELYTNCSFGKLGSSDVRIFRRTVITVKAIVKKEKFKNSFGTLKKSYKGIKKKKMIIPLYHRNLRSSVRKSVRSYGNQLSSAFFDSTIRDFKRMVDRTVWSKNEIRALVLSYFVSARMALGEYLKKIIARVIPPKIKTIFGERDNPLYILLVKIAYGLVNRALGMVSVFLNWLVRKEVFIKAVGIFLKAVNEGLTIQKALIILMLYKFLSVVNILLYKLQKSIDWFIEIASSILGLPVSIKNAIKKVFLGQIAFQARIVRGLYVYLEEQIKTIATEFGKTVVGKVLLHLKKVIEEALNNLGEETVLFVIRVCILLIMLANSVFALSGKDRWLIKLSEILGAIVNKILLILSRFSPRILSAVLAFLLPYMLFTSIRASKSDENSSLSSRMLKKIHARTHSHWNSLTHSDFISLVSFDSKDGESLHKALASFSKRAFRVEVQQSFFSTWADIYILPVTYGVQDEALKVVIFEENGIKVTLEDVARYLMNENIDENKRRIIESKSFDQIKEALIEIARKYMKRGGGTRQAFDGASLLKSENGWYIDQKVVTLDSGKVLRRLLFIKRGNEAWFDGIRIDLIEKKGGRYVSIRYVKWDGLVALVRTLDEPVVRNDGKIGWQPGLLIDFFVARKCRIDVKALNYLRRGLSVDYYKDGIIIGEYRYVGSVIIPKYLVGGEYKISRGSVNSLKITELWILTRDTSSRKKALTKAVEKVLERVWGAAYDGWAKTRIHYIDVNSREGRKYLSVYDFLLNLYKHADKSLDLHELISVTGNTIYLNEKALLVMTYDKIALDEIIFLNKQLWGKELPKQLTSDRISEYMKRVVGADFNKAISTVEAYARAKDLMIKWIKRGDIDSYIFIRFGSQLQDLSDNIHVRAFLCFRNLSTDEYVIIARHRLGWFNEKMGKMIKRVVLPVHRGIISRVANIYREMKGEEREGPLFDTINHIIKEFGENVYMPEWINESTYLNGKANIEKLIRLQRQDGINAITVKDVRAAIEKKLNEKDGERKILDSIKNKFIHNNLQLAIMVIISTISTSIGAFIAYRLLEKLGSIAHKLHNIGSPRLGIV